jgi:hypothetical protein
MPGLVAIMFAVSAEGVLVEIAKPPKDDGYRYEQEASAGEVHALK